MTDTPTPDGVTADGPSMADLQNAAAHVAGLDPKLASRLKGSGLAELVADARELHGMVAPAPAEPAPEAAAPAPTLADGVTGGPERREYHSAWSVEAVRKLAKSDPREFNRRVDAGEIDLGKLTS